MEIRSFGGNASPQLIEGRRIEGYGIVFNHESRVMFDKDRKRFFIEIIKDGAITEELLRSCDIKALLEHERSRMLARFNASAGCSSLELSIDAYGCKYRFDSPNTSDGDYAIEMIRRRDFFGSSFAYWTDERKNVTYEQRGDLLVRTVNKIDKVFDMSIVSDPAYFGTDVTVRSIEEIEASLNPPSNEFLDEINNLRKFI